MSVPQLQGFNSKERHSLFDEWERPVGDYPGVLWPDELLQGLMPEPGNWHVLLHRSVAERSGSKQAVLIDAGQESQALESQTWLNQDIGGVGVWGDGRFENGLKAVERGVNLEFFAQTRSHHDLRLPSLDVSLPFLWYWEAFEKEEGVWWYLDEAGRDQPLIRSQITQDEHKVEVRSRELRHYLATAKKSLLVQFDYRTSVPDSDFNEADHGHRSDWVNASWHCRSAGEISQFSFSFSRLLGQHVILGGKSSPGPPWDFCQRDQVYPSFVIAVDPSDGSPVSHSCDPRVLGTYFDRDSSRLHYLTPVYFDPKVLTRYLEEPTRYSVSSTSIRCLGIWSIAIGKNEVGQIEVYLGDLGRDLPNSERPHWLAHNQAPEGRMSESRFRRDFLAQFASDGDPVDRVRSALSKASNESLGAFGKSLWRPLKEPLANEWETLHRPVVDEPSAIYKPVLTITKATIDQLDLPVLRKAVGESDNGVPSLALLENLELLIGGNGSATRALRNVQNLRSSGGAAHAPGSKSRAAFRRAGIDGLAIPDAFDHLASVTAEALETLARLLQNAPGQD